MKTAKEMYRYARKNKLGFNWAWFVGSLIQKKHFKLIEENLLEKEEVLVSFIGRHKTWESTSFHEMEGEDSKHLRYRDTEGFFGYAITNEGRLMYAHWKPFHHDAMSIPLSNINNVNPDTQVIWGSVKIETFGENFSVLWTSKTIRRITKAIQQGVADARDGIMDGESSATRLASSHGSEKSEGSMYDELKQAKRAFDEGLITEEEYQKVKEKFVK